MSLRSKLEEARICLGAGRVTLPYPADSRTVSGLPVIFVVSTPSTRTCPVTLAAPQASVAWMNSDQRGVGVGGPPMDSRASLLHALTGTAYTGDRLYRRSK